MSHYSIIIVNVDDISPFLFLSHTLSVLHGINKVSHLLSILSYETMKHLLSVSCHFSINKRFGICVSLCVFLNFFFFLFSPPLFNLISTVRLTLLHATNGDCTRTINSNLFFSPFFLLSYLPIYRDP